MPVRLDDVAGTTVLLEVGVPLATGLHLVDSPVFDSKGNLFVTFSGTRGQQAPVSIFKVTPGGTREPFATGILNPTSLAIDPTGRLYVSSRFEGSVYRVGDGGAAEPFATDLGVACGLAFDPSGHLYVGDRSGSVFKVAPDGSASILASLPASVAAFHLAYGPDQNLYVTGPTLAPRDALYRVGPSGQVEVVWSGFGRPQGLAFDAAGSLLRGRGAGRVERAVSPAPPVGRRSGGTRTGRRLRIAHRRGDRSRWRARGRLGRHRLPSRRARTRPLSLSDQRAERKRGARLRSSSFGEVSPEPWRRRMAGRGGGAPRQTK